MGILGLTGILSGCSRQESPSNSSSIESFDQGWWNNSSERKIGGEKSKTQNYSEGHNYTEDLGNEVDLEMVWIPEGRVTDKYGKLIDKVIEGFWIERHEVTTRQFLEFVRKTGYLNKNPDFLRYYLESKEGSEERDLDLPVREISSEDAETFCKWLSLQTGRNYRLPHIAWWIRACTGDKFIPFNTGGIDLKPNQANILAENADESNARVRVVGSYPPSKNGLYDLHGNVAEMCYTTISHNDGTTFGSYEGCKAYGGSFKHIVWKSTARSSTKEIDYRSDVGFRVIRILGKD